jgi:hypothetical protein
MPQTKKLGRIRDMTIPSWHKAQTARFSVREGLWISIFFSRIFRHLHAEDFMRVAARHVLGKSRNSEKGATVFFSEESVGLGIFVHIKTKRFLTQFYYLAF